MYLTEAKEIAGTIGYPSKMPGTSYGLPAKACITGGKLAKIEGTPCNKCYAMRGNYLYENVEKAQAKRLAGIYHPHWVDALVLLLDDAHRRAIPHYHRWHDSGDIQSIPHLKNICRVAELTPKLMHWFPTQEGAMLKDFLKEGVKVPENLTIRLSTPIIDGKSSRSWWYTSSVFKDDTKGYGHICPAKQQDNKCGNCRACWDKSVSHVSYHLH